MTKYHDFGDRLVSPTGKHCSSVDKSARILFLKIGGHRCQKYIFSVSCFFPISSYMKNDKYKDHTHPVSHKQASFRADYQ